MVLPANENTDYLISLLDWASNGISTILENFDAVRPSLFCGMTMGVINEFLWKRAAYHDLERFATLPVEQRVAVSSPNTDGYRLKSDDFRLNNKESRLKRIMMCAPQHLSTQITARYDFYWGFYFISFATFNAAVSFQWKNPDLLFKNPGFLSRTPDFLLKSV